MTHLIMASVLMLTGSLYGESLRTKVIKVQPNIFTYTRAGKSEKLAIKLDRATAFNRTDQLSYIADGFELELIFIDQGDYVECNGTILSTDETEHCVTVELAFPVQNIGNFKWDSNIDDSQPIDPNSEMYAEFVDVFTQLPPDGAFNTAQGNNGGYGDKIGQGQMSYYPLASISSKNSGYAWGVDMGLPLVFRLSLQPQRGMVAAFDLGISPRTKKFPNRSHFKLYFFEHDPNWGFRSALAAYYDIQAEYFKKRVEHEGIWLPFTPLMSIEGWKDFGIAFHETHHSSMDRGIEPPRTTINADKLDPEVYSFQYTEPWDIQIPIKSLDAPYEEVVGEKTIPPDHLGYLKGSATLDKSGQYQARRLETPWFESGWAVSITTNVDPELPAPNRFGYVMKDEIFPAVKMNVDGIYFDSMEWNWHHDLNYNKDHFEYADYPLTFSTSLDLPRPAIWNYSSEYEMMKQVASETHSAGKLTMGNGFGWTPFAAGILDLFGAEFSWYHAADYDSRILQFRRSISNQKPIVVLLNEGFSDKAFNEAPYDGYRVYFERMLFYGFFPSFFSADASNDPYWADSKNYDQGRPFFKKYIPLIQTIASAGWQPITYAGCSNGEIAIERFGKTGDGHIYFTVMNTSNEVIHSTIDVDYRALGFSRPLAARELIAGESINSAKARRKVMTIPISIPPQRTQLIEITNKVK